MHPPAEMKRFRPSLLDRLFDDDPEPRNRNAAAPPPDEAQRRRRAAAIEMRQSREEWIRCLRRDIEALLNTKRAYAEVPEEYRHASESLLQYGLPDFTGMSVKSPADQAFLRSSIETTLRRFEPRLASITVTMDPPDGITPALRFHITALLRLYPDPEPIQFDTLVRADNRQVIVEERR